jgi:hypothetical protein
VLLQDDDDDHKHCRARVVPLEARGFLIPAKLYTNVCITQARVFTAPNGLYEQRYAHEPYVLR